MPLPISSILIPIPIPTPMTAGHGNTCSGGVDIPVCPNAMTQQRLEPGMKTIGADRNVYPTGLCNSLSGTKHDGTAETAGGKNVSGPSIAQQPSGCFARSFPTLAAPPAAAVVAVVPSVSGHQSGDYL